MRARRRAIGALVLSFGMGWGFSAARAKPKAKPSKIDYRDATAMNACLARRTSKVRDEACIAALGDAAKACDDKDSLSCFVAGQAYEKGYPGLPPDKARGASFYRRTVQLLAKACQNGPGAYCNIQKKARRGYKTLTGKTIGLDSRSASASNSTRRPKAAQEGTRKMKRRRRAAPPLSKKETSGPLQHARTISPACSRWLHNCAGLPKRKTCSAHWCASPPERLITRAIDVSRQAFAQRHNAASCAYSTQNPARFKRPPSKGCAVNTAAAKISEELSRTVSLDRTLEGELARRFLAPAVPQWHHGPDTHGGGNPATNNRAKAFWELGAFLTDIGQTHGGTHYRRMGDNLYVRPRAASGGTSWKKAMKNFEEGIDAHFENMNRRDAVGQRERAKANNTEARRRARDKARRIQRANESVWRHR